MLFKFLIGNSIGNLQTGLILSQFGGLLMIFMAFMAGDKMDERGVRLFCQYWDSTYGGPDFEGQFA